MKKRKIVIIAVICLTLGALIGGLTSYSIGRCKSNPCESNDDLNDILNYSCMIEENDSKVVCELENFSEKSLNIKNVTLKSTKEGKKGETTTVEINTVLTKEKTYQVEFKQNDVDKITQMELFYEYEKN